MGKTQGGGQSASAGLRSQDHRANQVKKIPRSTLKDLGRALGDSFRALRPVEHVRIRYELYERITGKVFRPC